MGTGAVARYRPCRATVVLQPFGESDMLFPMFSAEQERAFCDGFLLGQLVLIRAHEIQIPVTDAEKYSKLICEIASGETTVVTHPDEMLIKHPDARQWLKDYLNEHSGQLIERQCLWADFVRRHLLSGADE